MTNDKEEYETLNMIQLYSWEKYPGYIFYELIGKYEDIMKYYNKYILKIYPENPYFTRIQSRVTYENNENTYDVIVVTRKNSCS